MTATFADTPGLPSSLEEYVRGVSRLPVYGPDEERSLFRLARRGDEAALDAVVRAHLRLVVDLALERRGWGVSVERLIRTGNDGLRKAAGQFNPEGPRRFVDYAGSWVRREMREILDLH